MLQKARAVGPPALFHNAFANDRPFPLAPAAGMIEAENEEKGDPLSSIRLSDSGGSYTTPSIPPQFSVRFPLPNGISRGG